MTGADRIFSQTTNMLCASLVAVGYCLPVPAFACPAQSQERTIIFNHVPDDVDAAVIAEVTIIDMTPPDLRDLTSASEAVMNARVENVIKGQIGQRALRIVTPLSDCSNGFGAGVHGFVAGEPRSDPQGRLELVAINENIRKASARPQ